MKKTQSLPKKQVIADFSSKGQDPLVTRVQKQEEESLGKKGRESFTNRLIDLSDLSDGVLMKMKTVFPFDFFPDTITIDPIKVQITQKYFFLSQTVKSISVKDIVDTTVETGPWTSTLEVVTSEDANHPVRISYLRTKDAEQAMKIIKGLIISLKEAPK